MFILMLVSINDRFSIIEIIFTKIISNGFINNVSNDNGYIINETNGIKIMFINGEIIFIWKKLFICIGMLAKKDIRDIINVLDM